MSSVVIRFKNVAKAFKHNQVLKNVTFDVHSGEIFGIIGMSGSGKTTLLNTLIGFLEPDYGSIKFKLEHLLEFKEDEDAQFRPVFKNINDVKRTFGFAAQSPSFYENLTLMENLEYFGRMYGLSKDVRRTNAEILLKLMRLEDSRDVLAKNLSGGMQKRLDIACALVHDPKVLILDEPTADLDPLLRREMWELIKKINNKGTTILMASHFLDEIESLCDRVGILLEGTIVKCGTPDELKNFYTQDEEIHIQCSPGRYDVLINKLHGQEKKLNINRIINKGHKLVVYTLDAEKVLHFLLHIIEKTDESLLDVYVNKPSLEEAFESLIKQSRKEAQKDA
jgi:ABC-2 type transport system ATP-binding protein